MSAPTARTWTGTAVKVAGGVLAAVTGAGWLWCVVKVLTSRFASFEASTDPDSFAFDPHGFGLIFGTVFAVPLGLLCALTLPLTVSRSGRPRVLRLTMAIFGVVTILLLVALFSS